MQVQPVRVSSGLTGRLRVLRLQIEGMLHGNKDVLRTIFSPHVHQITELDAPEAGK